VFIKNTTLINPNHGEDHEGRESGAGPERALRRKEGCRGQEQRRRLFRQAVRPCPCGGRGQVPTQGDPPHGEEEDREEEQDQALPEGAQLQPPHAHKVHGGHPLRQEHRQQGGAEGPRKEEESAQGRQGEVRGEVQDGQEPLVFPEAQILVCIS